jgi:hypothetical protein
VLVFVSSHLCSCDSNTDFDPIDLDMHVTPANVAAAMSEGEHMQALLLALRLNEKPLLRRVYESVPVERIAVMAANLPRVYINNMYEITYQIIESFLLQSIANDSCFAGLRSSPLRWQPPPTSSSIFAGLRKFFKTMPRGFR